MKNAITLADIRKRPLILRPKVNIRQFLTNKKEPAEKISDITSSATDSRSGIVKDASFERKAFRRRALSLRFGYKK